MNDLFNEIISGRQFNFQPLEFGETFCYRVDVKDHEGTRWEFRMTNNHDGWKIEGEKLPEWILSSEVMIQKAIEAHE